MNRVAVRIIKRGNQYIVVGRSTSAITTSFDEAWDVSVPYFAGKKR